MKSKSFLLFCLLLSTSAISQITFEKGYYIDNSGQVHQVLLKYPDWKNNPQEIIIKTTENSEPQTLGVERVAEFAVDKRALYLRALVPIDQSKPNLKDLSKHGRFESKEEQVFLKMLVDGKADLLYYQNGGNEQFFLRNESGPIEALIYKRYIPEFSVRLAENNQYQQQLFNSLKCEDLTGNDFTAADYKKGDLVKIIKRYNSYRESDFIDFTESPDRDAFNLRIRPGVNFSSLVMNTYTVRRTMDFGNKTSLRLGLEGEYVLPFFRDKWAFIVEPTYQTYKGEAIFPEGQFGDGMVSV